MWSYWLGLVAELAGCPHLIAAPSPQHGPAVNDRGYVQLAQLPGS